MTDLRSDSDGDGVIGPAPDRLGGEMEDPLSGSKSKAAGGGSSRDAADERWMREALEEARSALESGEVPVGAVVVRGGEIIARGHNEVEGRGTATAHAEMIAIEEASGRTGDWRLEGCSLYVTSEPCHMCLGALYLARADRVVYGARQPRSGACGSAGNLHDADLHGHRLVVKGGVLEEECLLLLQEFFTRLRED
jgi:tRNA(adenine34) deaminase